MVKVHVFRNGSVPTTTQLFPDGFTVGEFFCKDFLAYPISPVRILVNGRSPSLRDSLEDGDEIRIVIEPNLSQSRH